MKFPGVGFFVLFLKIGPKVLSALAKMLKGFKFGKVGLAGASIASYSIIFTWQFALMIMTLLFVHESGHVWAMKRCGMKTKGMYFIPFLGAAAVADEAFPSRNAEAYIAIMGPIWGLAISFLAGAIYLLTANPLFAAGASWMALVNLFNLLPVSPLDGGRIIKSIAFSIHSRLGLLFLGIGIVLACLLAYFVSLGLFSLLLIIGGLDLVFEYKRRTEHSAMNFSGIIWYTLSFLALVGILWALMYFMKHVPGAEGAMDLLKG